MNKTDFAFFLQNYLEESHAMNALKKTIASGEIQQIEVGDKGAEVRKVKPSITMFGVRKELGPKFLKTAAISRLGKAGHDVSKELD